MPDFVTATSRFYSSLEAGDLPVAVPIRYGDVGIGLVAGGLNLDGDTRATAMAFSGDSQTRAAASIIVCAQAHALSALGRPSART